MARFVSEGRRMSPDTEDVVGRIRVLIADDHPMMLSGIAAMLSAEPDMAVVAQAATGAGAIEAFRIHRPDIVLLDLNLPDLDGIAVIGQIRSEFPEAGIVVLTSYAGDVHAARATKAGAQAFLLKTMIRSEMLQAIRQVHSGGRYLPESVAQEIAVHIADRELTEREIEVLRMVAKMGPNKRVAAAMGVAEGTIKVHMKSVISKLGAVDRTQAVAIAIRRGIISL